MSIHSSLRTSQGAAASFRNVMKRYERVRHLLAQGVWAPGQSVLGLAKIKQMKMKARKAAAKEKDAASAQPPAAAPTPPSA